jgi:chloramphenicol 3-O phosphotransferase
MQATPRSYQPGIGLRPGEPDRAAAPLVPTFDAAWYESIAAHSRVGLNVVADPRPPRRRDPRRAGQPGRAGRYATGSPEDPVPVPVQLWQLRLHDPGIYDPEVDTSILRPEACADAIRRGLDGPPPSAFARLARR